MCWLRSCCTSRNSSPQANRKTKELPRMRTAMRSLNTSTPRRQNSCSGQPAISVDTKQKEQIGEYKNGGREWHPKSQPESVHVHDFAKQKDVPDGVYDLGQNAGWVSVGTDH